MKIKGLYWIITGVIVVAMMIMAAIIIIEDLPMNTFPTPMWIALGVAVCCSLVSRRKKENSSRD